MTPLPPAPRRFVLVASTGGAVLGECLKNPWFRSQVHSLVCDQPCGAADRARLLGVPVVPMAEADSEKFCAFLHDYLQTHAIDFVLSFYTKFFSEKFRRAHADRVVNFHPSLLPAFKGNDAWEYVQAYGVRFAGSTVEFVHERMDEGKIILQAVCPWDDARPAGYTRHRIFIHQCQSVLQVTRWLSEGRVRTEGHRVIVSGATFSSPEFSPALDFPDALQFSCSAPPASP